MKYKLFSPLSIHEIGQRTNQEDALWPTSASKDDRLFILCDGMGGHEKGEVASQTVSQAIGEWLKIHTIKDMPVEDTILHEALAYAYTSLDQFANDSLRQMGTTLTLLYMHRHGVTAMHMGDSRIYHVRPGESLLYQSRDHSLVFDLYLSGEISYEEMRDYPQKNVVTRAMMPGQDNRMKPDIIHITDIQPDDWFYMCSDGMIEQMEGPELVKILSSDKSDKEKRQQLIEATKDNQDNHTAWLIHIDDVIHEDEDKQLENEEPTARCNALNILPRDDDNDDVVLVTKPKKSLFQKFRSLFGSKKNNKIEEYEV